MGHPNLHLCTQMLTSAGGFLDGSEAAANTRADSSGSSTQLGRYPSGAGLAGLGGLSLARSSGGGAAHKTPSNASRSQQISWLGWLMGYTAANADASSTAAAAVAAAALAGSHICDIYVRFYLDPICVPALS